MIQSQLTYGDCRWPHPGGLTAGRRHQTNRVRTMARKLGSRKTTTRVAMRCASGSLWGATRAGGAVATAQQFQYSSPRRWRNPMNNEQIIPVIVMLLLLTAGTAIMLVSWVH